MAGGWNSKLPNLGSNRGNKKCLPVKCETCFHNSKVFSFFVLNFCSEINLFSHVSHVKLLLIEKANFFETEAPNWKILFLVKSNRNIQFTCFFILKRGIYKVKVLLFSNLPKKWENKAANINTPDILSAEWQRYNCPFIVQPTSCGFFLLRRNNAKEKSWVPRC